LAEEIPPVTGAKEPGPRGEREHKLLKPLRGECRAFSGVTVVTNARAFYTTRAAAGASGARHSLRPLFSEGRTIRVNLAQSCGEIAKLRLQAMRLIRNHYISSPDRRLFPKPTVDKVARQSR
jgi:hypothetical protein